MWFLCKVSYYRQHEDGTYKKQVENYLLDAINFSEAETRVFEEVGSGLENFTVMSVTKSNIHEVFRYTDSEVWYKCKVQYTSVDESKGKEKQVTETIILTAVDLRQANDRLTEKLRGMQVPYELVEISKSPILEVFPFKAADERVRVGLKPLESTES